MNGQAGLYTPKQTADYFGISVRTLFEWRKSGKIKAIQIDRVVRFHPNEISRVVKENTVHNRHPKRKYF